MGLNDGYAQERSQILMMSPEPSVNQAYAMIIHYESQKKCLLEVIVLLQVEWNPQPFMLQKRMPHLCIQPEVHDQDNHLVWEVINIRRNIVIYAI